MILLIFLSFLGFFGRFSAQIDGEEVKSGDCSVQIGRLYWNFHDLFKNSPVQQINFEGLLYYISPRGPLKKRDVPEYASLSVDVRALCCNRFKMECWEIAYGTDFDFKHEDSTNFSKGIIYFADGKPYTNDTSKLIYNLYEISHNIHCDSSATGQVSPSISTLRNGERVQIIFDWKTSYGCPIEKLPVPSPPMSFEPKCNFKSIIGNSSLERLGINVDFAKLNNGPVGIRSIYKNGDDSFLFYYTPCGFSDCPYTAKSCEGGIGDRAVSSAWICTIEVEGEDNVIGKCSSYGIERESPDYQVFGDEWSGLTHTLYLSDNKYAQIHYDCELPYPNGYIEMPTLFEKFNDKSLIVNVDSSDICMKIIPVPIPHESLCRVNVSMNGPQKNPYNIDVDLIHFNKEKGYKIDDFTIRSMPPQTRTLIFQPCGPLLCPTTSVGKAYYCFGDEDATIWICDEKGGAVGNKLNCEAFGLYDNVSLFEIDLIDRSIMNGLKFTFSGGLHRYAEFSLMCDESLLSYDLELDSYATMDGSTLKFSGRSKSICASGSGPTPTPIPVAEPIKPLVTITPTPIPRPNSDIFMYNSSQFIYIDLKAVDRVKYQKDGILFINQTTGPIYSEYSPWDKIPCPIGWKCESYVKSANTYSCWKVSGTTGELYCHNSGDINMGINGKLIKGESLDSGVVLTYGGGYGVLSKLKIACKIGKNASSLTSLNSVVEFSESGKYFEYSTTSELACPSNFMEVDIPRYTPTPTPSRPLPSYQWKSKTIEGKQIYVNLNELDRSIQRVHVGNGNNFEKLDIFFSPGNRAPCPSPYNCPTTTDMGNVYKCFNLTSDSQCYVIGDSAYEINFILSDENDLNNGFRIEYGGGLGSYEVFMQFYCNESIKNPKYMMHEVGHMYASKKIIIEIESEIACPVNAERAIYVTFGAVFLLIIFVSISLYVIPSVTFIFCTTGLVRLPHTQFWSEFLQSLETGLLFVLTCGKYAKINDTTYDKI